MSRLKPIYFGLHIIKERERKMSLGTSLAEYKKEIDQLQAEAEKLGGDAKAKLNNI